MAAYPIHRLRVTDARFDHPPSRQRSSYSRTGSSKPRRALSPRSANRKPLPAASRRGAGGAEEVFGLRDGLAGVEADANAERRVMMRPYPSVPLRERALD